MAVAVILGSAFAGAKRGDGAPGTVSLGGCTLQPVPLETAHGAVELHRYPRRSDAWVLFRHGQPHRWLPHQIPFRAHAAALAAVGCGALLVTSSVGVLVADLPLDAPLVVGDLLMPDNRLPSGEVCTMFPVPAAGQGHLVLEDGLLSSALNGQLERLLTESGQAASRRVVFAYVPGPRTKTAAENAWWRAAGAEVNSMTLGPEVVLANELGIPTAALVVGHKRSAPEVREDLGESSVRAQLSRSQDAMEALVVRWLEEAEPVPFANQLYRFEGGAERGAP